MDDRSRAQVLNDVRRDIARLEEELAALRGLEVYLTRKVETDHAGGLIPPVGARGSFKLRINNSMTQAEAAEIALRAIGRPARIGEIAKKMLELGYETDREQRVFRSSLYSAMSRAKDQFKWIGRGTFGLSSYQENGSEK